MPRHRIGAVTALAPWFGAKRTLAPRIVHQLGPHRCYWEPFCGSMAVLLAKPSVTQESVNDLHGDLVHLARVIRDEHLSGQLYWRLRRTLCCEALFRESRAVVRSRPAPTFDCLPSLERAYHYFVASWQGINGVAGTPDYHNGFARRYSSKGGSAGIRFRSVVESLPDWHERLRSVAIYSGCGLTLCERIEDRDGTTIYVDPPYLVKGAKYTHAFTPADHERLAAALRRFTRTRVVVSYYDHPDLSRLYPDWSRVDVATRKQLVNLGRAIAGQAIAPEVLLVNGNPIPEEQA